MVKYFENAAPFPRYLNTRRENRSNKRREPVRERIPFYDVFWEMVELAGGSLSRDISARMFMAVFWKGVTWNVLNG